MLGKVLAILAAGAFVGTSSATAAISVDGNISDWQALGLVHTDNITNSGGTLEIQSYGATIMDGTFYAFVQTTASGLNTYYPGAWINADQSSTELLNTDPIAPGTDIVLEYDQDDALSISENFWGGGGDVNNDLPVTGGSYAVSGDVTEWSAPVSDIQAALASLPSPYNVPSGTPWSVIIAGEASPNWGRSAGGPITVVPEPASLALLGIGLMGLCCRAKRTLK